MLHTAELANPHRPTVFLVDLVRSTQARITRLMGAHLFQVSAHATAESMPEAASRTAAGCVIFESQLPRDGRPYGAGASVRVLPCLATVFLTDEGTVSSRARAIKVGARDFLEKSYTNTALRAAIAMEFGTGGNRGANGSTVNGDAGTCGPAS